MENEIAGWGPLGGSAVFLRNQIEASARIPLGAVDMGLSLRGGLLLPSTWLPAAPSNLTPPMATKGSSCICDRFFLGGPHDVRGFAPRGIGPHSGTDSLGGDVFAAAAFHLYAPLPFSSLRQRIGESLRTHAFVNVGSLASMDWVQQRPAASAAAAILARLHAGLSVAWGVGLVLDTGQFSAELNLCLPLRRGQDSLVSPRLQFGVGFSFL